MLGIGLFALGVSSIVGYVYRDKWRAQKREDQERRRDARVETVVAAKESLHATMQARQERKERRRD